MIKHEFQDVGILMTCTDFYILTDGVREGVREGGGGREGV